MNPQVMFTIVIQPVYNLVVIEVYDVNEVIEVDIITKILIYHLFVYIDLVIWVDIVNDMEIVIVQIRIDTIEHVIVKVIKWTTYYVDFFHYNLDIFVMLRNEINKFQMHIVMVVIMIHIKVVVVNVRIMFVTVEPKVYLTVNHLLTIVDNPYVTNNYTTVDFFIPVRNIIPRQTVDIQLIVISENPVILIQIEIKWIRIFLVVAEVYYQD